MPPSEPRRKLFPLLSKAERETVTKWILRLGPYAAFLGLVAGFIATIPHQSIPIPTIPCALSVPISPSTTVPKMENLQSTSSFIGTPPPVPSETSQPSATSIARTTTAQPATSTIPTSLPSTPIPTDTTTSPLTDTKQPPSSQQSIPTQDLVPPPPSTIVFSVLPEKLENFPTSGRRSSEITTESLLPNNEKQC